VAAVDTYRTEVARPGGYRCEYCGYPEAASSTPLEVDHIIPEAKGGSTTLDNLALCCRSYNLHKHVKTEALDSVTNEIVPLFNPRTLQWNEHFASDHSTGEIRGSTSIGRASVEALAINSTHAIATRRLLIRLRLI
jgi:HNH endonuclease